MARSVARAGDVRRALPVVWLMSDERIPDFMTSVRRMPIGSGLIFRHHLSPPKARLRLFRRVRAVTRARRMTLLLAGSRRVARSWGADGAHRSGKSPTRARGGSHWQGRAFWCSMSVHDGREAARARRSGVDLALISPLFATRSHPGKLPLVRHRAAALAGKVKPGTAAALGGMTARRWRGLARTFPAGWAAIDAWGIGTSGPRMS